MNSPNVLAVFEAAKTGDLQPLQTALALGAPVDSRREIEHTPLMVACQAGHSHIVEELLAAGADINARSSDQHTPLMFAAWAGHQYLTDRLIERGANVQDRSCINQSLIHFSVFSGKPEMVRRTLDFGLPINEFDLIGDAPLHQACEDGVLEVVQVLLEAGADIDSADPFFGVTPLMRAVGSRRATIARYLLEHGAGMYYRDLNGGFVKRSQYRKEKWNAQSLFEYIERLKSRGKMKKFTATLEGTMPEIVEFHTLNGSVLGSGTFHCQGGLLSFLVRPETFETMSIKDRQDAIPIVTAYFSIEPTGDMVDVFLMDVTPI